MKEKIENLLKESFNNIQKNVRGITQKFSEIQKAIIRNNIGAISEENGRLINSDGEEFNPLTDSSQVTHNGDKLNEIIDTITDEVDTLTDRVNSNTEIISSLTGSGDGSVTKIVTDAINTLDSEVASVNNPDIVVTVTEKDGKLSKVSVESNVPNNTTFNALKNKVDAFLEATEVKDEVINTLSEIQDYIKSDLEGAAAMSSSIHQNTTDIANEKTRAELAESENAKNIANEKTRAELAESVLATSINNEVTRATEREDEIAYDLSDEVTRATEREDKIADDLAKEVEKLSQCDTYLQTQKADKSGYFKDLKVGTADNLLTKNEEVDSEFVIRPITTDNENLKVGTARINTIKGNSVVWNCDYKSGAVSAKVSLGGNRFVYRKTISVNVQQTKGDKIYVCQTLNNKVDLITNANSLTRTFGHNSANKAEIVLGSIPNTYIVNPSFFTKGVHTYATIHTVGDYTIDTIYCDLQQEDGITDYSEYSVKLVDLTKMFGSGNEPTTVEEFEALYGNMPNEYNEGTIIDNHTTVIKSVGVNAWDGQLELGMYDEQGKVVSVNYNRCKNPIRVIGDAKYYFSSQMTGISFQVYYYDVNMNYVGHAGWARNHEYTIPTNAYYMGFFSYFQEFLPEDNDICIHLVHTGYLNGKYFPYESQTRQLPTVEGGLKSAGSVYDEIRYNKSKDKWEHVKRIGSVDLGTLNWTYRTTGLSHPIFQSVIDRTRGTLFNALSANYNIDKKAHVNAEYFLGANENIDKIIGANNNDNFDTFIFVKDSTYTSATAFKQAMQGVILNYELAEPVVTELDVDISPDYKVWDYGTEEAISEQLSTPLKPVISREFISNSQIVDNHIDIEVERERAINKEKELESLIFSNQTDSDNKITAESNRAQLVETTIQNNLNTEVARATEAESNLNTLINNEITRATNAEDTLTTELNKVKDELTATNEVVVEEFTFEPHNQDSGVAQINSIHGNSVVWNQQLKSLFSPNLTANSVTSNGITFTKMENGCCNISGSNNTSSNSLSNNSLKNASVIAGHKYIILVRGCKKSTVQYYSLNSTNVTFDSNTSGVITPTADSGILLQAKVSSGVTDVNENIFCELVDLTKMFNGVNEPTTVEEFELLYGNMPSDYNEGEIINNKISSIKSVGTNIWDEEWEIGAIDENGNKVSGDLANVRTTNFTKVIGGATYYSTTANCIFACYDKDKNFIPYNGETGSKVYQNMIDVYPNTTFTIPNNVDYVRMWVGRTYGTTYNNDICINLSDESINGKYFPYEDFVRELPTIEYELKSVGNVYDEIRYNVSTDKWEYIQRVGSVDLSTLSWYKTTNSFGSSSIMNVIQPPSSNTSTARILCAKYNVFWQSAIFNGEQTGVSIGVDKNIFIRDTTYTDVATFKTAMSGVILYYELAEPIVTELSDDYNLSYQISKCGTVEAISDGLSSPFKGEIEYSTTIANKINNNIRQIEYLDNKIDELSDNQIKVTHSELVSLRDNSKLKPGCWYRITDYVTTTSQENTQSAGHQFDVLVLATDVNVLSEEARAINHQFEVDPNKPIRYGSEYIGAPKYNNLYLFEATGESTMAQSGVTYWILKCYYVSDGEITEVPSSNACVTTSNPPVVGESVYMGATLEEALEASFLNIGEPINPDHFANSNLNIWKLWYCLDNDIDRFEWATNGTGIIYRMIDEYDNDCPYDFKNILFNNFFTFGKDTDFTMLSANRSILNTIKSSYINNKRVLPFITFEVTSKNTKIDNNVFYINVKGTENSEVIGATILYGVSGTYDNILDIEIPNNNLPMKVAKNSNGEIKIYNEVDLIS